MSDRSPQRNVIAVVASIFLGPIMVWAGAVPEPACVGWRRKYWRNRGHIRRARGRAGSTRWHREPLRDIHDFRRHYCPVLLRNQVCLVVGKEIT